MEGASDSITGKGKQDARGWCLEVHDLAISKYAAGRDKDLDFTRALARHGFTSRDILMERLTGTVMDSALRRLTESRIEANFAKR